MAGSYGTLAALTEVTFKVLPRSEAERSLLIPGLDDAAATRAMTAALNSPHEVSGAAHLPRGADGADRPLAVLRLEGPGPSVTARAAALAQELASFGTIDDVRDGASHQLWRAIGEVAPLAQDAQQALWRLSVAPSAGAPLAAELARRLDHRHFFDWGGGLLWLAVRGGEDGGAAVIRASIARLGGHATLVRGADALRAAVPVFQPQAPALAALSRRVKESFDPQRILNRGRMYADL